jgi:hypothetical protein
MSFRFARRRDRDATLTLVAYRHGLRAIELCDLEWSQVEFDRMATCRCVSVPAPASGLSNPAMRDTVIFVVILSLIIAATFALVFFGMPR